jgi:hypothetical protein
MTVGRPTKYKPEFCEVAIKEMAQGASIKELPLYFGVCIDTINEWRHVHPEFSAAINKGIGLSEAWWMTAGRACLRDKNFQYVGWYMNMKNRFGWADKQETKIDAKVMVEERLAELK